jgi:SAM-dependent methyltransferase
MSAPPRRWRGASGLAARVSYCQASALALPFEAGTFDGAYMMHVGMNIADKPALFAEVRRVLKPGAMFAIYDVMRTGAGELRFPLHWAATPETSFVVGAAEYRRALEAGGFSIIKERDRGYLAHVLPPSGCARRRAERTAPARHSHPAQARRAAEARQPHEPPGERHARADRAHPPRALATPRGVAGSHSSTKVGAIRPQICPKVRFQLSQ